MQVFNEINALKHALSIERKDGKKIGFVPTMGFFHDGHMSLMKEAINETDCVVVSIFVNPTQFGPGEDFESYPRNMERDLKLCEELGVHYVFTPEVSEMYPAGYSTFVECEGGITHTLCGASRPGHFKGVTSVVNKLFNIVEPDLAFFGQKDAQQVAVLDKMVRDLNMNLKIIPCPIMRENDGLAMSSRNVYLNAIERKEALVLSESLKIASSLIQDGERNSNKIIEQMKAHIMTASSAVIDYVQIVENDNLSDIDTVVGDVLFAVAVRIGKTRLIDNMRMTI
ncbi:MAG: pantoate--beta-alanine ligase [Clostridia bacterium]|nr:pantoate--beta-alanine ligase [Clostridia bacterium]